MKWYSFQPQDTLFFRGAESAEMGADHSASTLFPPPTGTIAGALRTAVLIQNGISFKEYTDSDFFNESIIASIGKSSETPPFSVTGPLFRNENDIFIPAPYSWYITKEESKTNAEHDHFVKEELDVIKGKPEKSSLFISDSELLWVKGNTLESIGGRWIKLEDIGKHEITIYNLSYFAENEIRTGIALNGRNVREHHLYTFRHYRLKLGIELAFGIDKELPIAEQGVLKLGAEQRFGEYRLMKKMKDIPSGNSGTFMSLSLTEGDDKSNSSVVAAGRIIYLGGWDLKLGFHKPMKGYFPPGTVFNKKINDNCIEI